MRHKWEKKINHPYCHIFICTVCGCIKDASAMWTVKYEMGNVKTFTAPKCKKV